MKRLLVILFLLILFYKTTAQTGRLPFILQDEKKLTAFKQLYKNKDKNVIEQVDSLVAEANKALNSGAFSVTFQKSKTSTKRR